MTLAPGSRLGPYEILARIGAGGMGEVYRARDTRLDRDVAIKVLPAHLSSPEMRQRFDREAKAVSQLSHSNICALYDIGRDGEIDYLVMELLDGETLSARLARGPLPLEHTLRYGREMANALDRAHRQGIVHRDLKPGNVMLTKSGVKLLDFGLAKVMMPSASLSQLSMLPTTPKGGALTQEGTILGTFQYMAPEQLEGKEADERTDIFALGAVLYEMATGRKAFAGASQASLISAIMQSDPPPISSVQPVTPPALDRVVMTCLAKDPEDRWRSAGDVAKELKWIAEGPASGREASIVGRPKRRDWLGWAVAAAAILFGVYSTFAPLRRPQAPEELTRFTILPPAGQSVIWLAFSPDSRRLLFIFQDEGGKTPMAVRSLDSLEMRMLPGTERARGGFWSFDGREIAFFSDGKLRRIGAEGGPVQTICDAGSGFPGSWNREGTILFTKDFGTPIFAVSSAGGTARPVTTLDTKSGEVAHFYPAFLPDGRHFVFVARNVDPEKTSIHLASIDGKDVRRLFRADSAAIYAEPGYLLFARDSALFAWKFDAHGARLVGDPVPAFEQVFYATEDNHLGATVAGKRAAYLSWPQGRKLVWLDRKGRELGTLGETGPYGDVRISPDGRKVAVSMRDPSRGQNLDLWVLDASRGTGSRITSERTDEFNPAWFPDGERLAYVSDRAGFYDLYERSTTGGPEKLLVRSKEDKVLPTVTADGRHLLYSLSEGARFLRVLAPLPAGTSPRRLSGDSPFSEDHPEISPDGQWTAFESGESGQKEVYLDALSGGSKRQVSIGGGQAPIWNRNGSELFYIARDGMLTSAALRHTAGGLETGQPQPLFPLRLGSRGGEIQFFRRSYDVSPDGQRFLVIRRAADTEADGAVVVTNWTAALPGGR
ncbi:MAG: protein kinase [Acidobacteriota bacterium]|nr:protein kinase [Acidobacteriota bacterium]